MLLRFAKNERFYHIHLQSNLFGGTTLISSWGAFDSNRGGHKYTFCDNREEVEPGKPRMLPALMMNSFHLIL